MRKTSYFAMLAVAVLTISLLALSGCSSAPTEKAPVSGPAPTEIEANLILKEEGGKKFYEVTFFTAKPDPKDPRTMSGSKETIPVDEPQLDGVGMSPSANDASQQTYHIDAAPMKVRGSVSAKFAGKLYEGKMFLDPFTVGRLNSVLLSQKAVN